MPSSGTGPLEPPEPRPSSQFAAARFERALREGGFLRLPFEAAVLLAAGSQCTAGFDHALVEFRVPFLAVGELHVELFEAAYVREPNGPPNLVANLLLARSGAATAEARRLVERPDGKGREGAGTLQTHLHYASCFADAAAVGEVVDAANPPSKAQTAFEVACSWAKAGNTDVAAAWLEKAADAGFRAASVVDGDPDLATVRADPRWPLLRARLV